MPRNHGRGSGVSPSRASTAWQVSVLGQSELGPGERGSRPWMDTAVPPAGPSKIEGWEPILAVVQGVAGFIVLVASVRGTTLVSVASPLATCVPFSMISLVDAPAAGVPGVLHPPDGPPHRRHAPSARGSGLPGESASRHGRRTCRGCAHVSLDVAVRVSVRRASTAAAAASSRRMSCWPSSASCSPSTSSPSSNETWRSTAPSPASGSEPRCEAAGSSDSGPCDPHGSGQTRRSGSRCGAMRVPGTASSCEGHWCPGTHPRRRTRCNCRTWRATCDGRPTRRWCRS